MNITSLDLLKPNISQAIHRHIKIDFQSEISEVWQAHRELAKFNAFRLNPQFPNPQWSEDFEDEIEILRLEDQVLQWELNQIRSMSSLAPTEANDFMKWFESLKELRPGQETPFFEWLAEHADRNQMRWFIQQEAAGEAGFDDLVALTQLKFPTRPKLEMARNYWDEMGRGKEKGMHGALLEKVSDQFGISATPLEQIIPEGLALGNILIGFAANRRYAYHSVGALGAVELTAPRRARKVYEGLKRLGVSGAGYKYYLLHSTLDEKHSMEWNKEVIFPLISQNPSLTRFIAEGALLRLHAGARCFERYQEKFKSQLH